MPQTYVMITGAWHGGWAWRPVAQHLRASGHTVLTPTLPGLQDGDDPAAHKLPTSSISSLTSSNDATSPT